MGIRKRVEALLPGGSEGVDNSPLEGTDPAVEEAEDADPAGLFNCASCGTTYISETMDACPDCDTAVESIPTEVDLGMV